MTGIQPPAVQPWRPAPPPHPRAVLSLVLGIVGLSGVVFLLPFAVSPLAWYFGAVARREAQREEQRWSPSAMATSGMIMGAVGTALLVVGALALGGIAVLTALLLGTDTGY